MPTVKIKVVVYHTSYGCETGCCGHMVELADTCRQVGDFSFGHPYDARSKDEYRRWALELAQERVTEKFGAGHTADLDWDNCRITND